MVFLGIEVNTITMSLKIPKEKLTEILKELEIWKHHSTTTQKQVQKLAGLLNFACRCVKSGRIYLARILNFLRSLKGSTSSPVPDTVRKDIQWWQEFTPQFNAVSLMMDNQFSRPYLVIASDSCLSGGGVVSQTQFFHLQYNKKVLEFCTHINQLECAVLVAAIKVWGKSLERKRFVMKCDNQNTVRAINTGNLRDPVMQACLRELHKILAFNSCKVRAVFLTGSSNQLADCLSRWHLHPRFKKEFEKRTAHSNLKEVKIEPEIFDFIFRK